MTEENLKWLENVFRRTVGENGEIRLQDFKNIVHSKNVSHPFTSRKILVEVCYILRRTYMTRRFNRKSLKL